MALLVQFLFLVKSFVISLILFLYLFIISCSFVNHTESLLEYKIDLSYLQPEPTWKLMPIICKAISKSKMYQRCFSEVDLNETTEKNSHLN